MSTIRIKICGITRIEDAQHAVQLGADAIGMILSTNSPRKISIAQAAKIRPHVPKSVDLVGVFVDESTAFIEQAYREIGLDMVQLHGQETSDYATSLGLPYIKAVRAKNRLQVEQQLSAHAAAQAILLDPYVKGVHGGTGQELDLDLWPGLFEPPVDPDRLILAGGLTPANVRERVDSAKALAVDLSSGVESAPGIKSLSLMTSLFAVLRPTKQGG